MSEFENSNTESTESVGVTPEQLAETERTVVFNELQELDWGFRYQSKDGANIELLRHTVKVIKGKVEARKATVTALEEWVRDQTDFEEQAKELLTILEEHLALDITTNEVIDVTIGAKVYITRKVWEDADAITSDVVDNLNISISEGYGDTTVDDYEITSIEKEW